MSQDQNPPSPPAPPAGSAPESAPPVKVQEKGPIVVGFGSKLANTVRDGWKTVRGQQYSLNPSQERDVKGIIGMDPQAIDEMLSSGKEEDLQQVQAILQEHQSIHGSKALNELQTQVNRKINPEATKDKDPEATPTDIFQGVSPEQIPHLQSDIQKHPQNRENLIQWYQEMSQLGQDSQGRHPSDPEIAQRHEDLLKRYRELVPKQKRQEQSPAQPNESTTLAELRQYFKDKGIDDVEGMEGDMIAWAELSDELDQRELSDANYDAEMDALIHEFKELDLDLSFETYARKFLTWASDVTVEKPEIFNQEPMTDESKPPNDYQQLTQLLEKVTTGHANKVDEESLRQAKVDFLRKFRDLGLDKKTVETKVENTPTETNLPKTDQEQTVEADLRGYLRDDLSDEEETQIQAWMERWRQLYQQAGPNSNAEDRKEALDRLNQKYIQLVKQYGKDREENSLVDVDMMTAEQAFDNLDPQVKKEIKSREKLVEKGQKVLNGIREANTIPFSIGQIIKYFTQDSPSDEARDQIVQVIQKLNIEDNQKNLLTLAAQAHADEPTFNDLFSQSASQDTSPPAA